MNHEKLLKQIAHFDLPTLPPDVRKEYHENEEFRAEFEELRQTQLLVSLKRHEKTDQETQARILKGIRRGVRMKNTRVSAGEKAWTFCTRFIFPTVAYGTAALAILFVSVHYMFANKFPVAESLSWESEFTAPNAQPDVLVAIKQPVRNVRANQIEFADIETTDDIDYGFIPGIDTESISVNKSTIFKFVRPSFLAVASTSLFQNGRTSD